MRKADEESIGKALIIQGYIDGIYFVMDEPNRIITAVNPSDSETEV